MKGTEVLTLGVGVINLYARAKVRAHTTIKLLHVIMGWLHQ